MADSAERGTGTPPLSALRSPLPYSYRSASTGSSRLALVAGYIPKQMPVMADAPTAATTDQSGTAAGPGVKDAMAQARRAPTARPIAPPIMVSEAASTRN